MEIKKRVVFFDRDGVINEMVDRGENFVVQGKPVRYTAPFHYHEFKLRPGVLEALTRVRAQGFLCILVTNQPDITYGIMSKEEYDKIMLEVIKLPFDDIFVCFHGRGDGCECKKPKPGMLLSAADKWNIDLTSSYIVGDTVNDIEAGRAAACRTVILEYPANQAVSADFRASTLAEIADLLERN